MTATIPAERIHRNTLCLAISLSMAIALAASGAAAGEDAADIAATSAEVGRDPLYCALVAPDRNICTWHVAKSHHLVCEFDAASRRTPEPCVRTADNDSMRTFSKSDRPGARQRGGSERLAEEQAARAAFENAGSIDGIIRLVGAGPAWCRTGQTLECGWYAARRTPGYVVAARFAGSPGRKVGVTCEFRSDGSLFAGSCTANATGSPRPPSR